MVIHGPAWGLVDEHPLGRDQPSVRSVLDHFGDAQQARGKHDVDVHRDFAIFVRATELNLHVTASK